MSASLDLARRAVACKGWRWTPGMRALHVSDGRGWRVLDGPVMSVFDPEQAIALVEPHVMTVGKGNVYPPSLTPTRLLNPDLDDPATLGCLLALVREAWGWAVQVETPGEHTDLWLVLCPELGPEEDGFPLVGSIDISGYTEAEALVAALEAAP